MARFLNVDTRLIRKKKYERSFDPLHSLDDLALYKDYRFDKEGILFLTNLLQDDLLQSNDGRGLPIKPHIAVMATLSYLGSNAFQLKIGDTLGISQSSVSRCVKMVTLGLAKKVDQFVKFPLSDESRRSCQSGFFQLAGFPGVVSCVDGTHIKILKPSQDEHQVKFYKIVNYISNITIYNLAKKLCIFIIQKLEQIYISDTLGFD